MAEAQAALGEMLRDGRGGRRDLKGAARLFELSARQGHAWGIYALAGARLHGEGLPRERALSIRLYRRAAALGLAPAMYELGLCLCDGLGVARDGAAALRWFRRAAARGHALAAARVGRAYWWGGLGAPRDRVRAAPFLLAAARRGEPEAATLLKGKPGPAPRQGAGWRTVAQGVKGLRPRRPNGRARGNSHP